MLSVECLMLNFNVECLMLNAVIVRQAIQHLTFNIQH